MAVAVYFHPKGMTLKQFEESHRLLDEAGQTYPNGRIHHSCFGDDGDLMIYDIWASTETFEEFGETLMPILAKIGIDPGQPSFMPLHKLRQQASG